MKEAIYTVILLFVLTSVSCQTKTDFVKVDKSKVDKEQFELVKNLTDKILTEQKDGGYYSLSDSEATVQMIEGLSESVQKESYGTIKNLFGDYEDLSFEFLMESTDANKYKIYRFKGNFETSSDVEVRTVLNKEGKLAGFYIKPWNEKL
ncbi:hypothetical protein [uncultured Eudoraea sp.]|uniref:hypothetical protein n=1 Tax=uncultured Eudoraea sp. TaxID=1035614 RepID=UPI002621C411|nr:hypothetical protein [uncultured Eudoraea sp.]